MSQEPLSLSDRHVQDCAERMVMAGDGQVPGAGQPRLPVAVSIVLVVQ
jgi:hypothetical protein